jgi:hypothetical protein
MTDVRAVAPSLDDLSTLRGNDVLSLDPDGDVVLDFAAGNDVLSISISAEGRVCYVALIGKRAFHGQLRMLGDTAKLHTTLAVFVPPDEPSPTEVDRTSGAGATAQTASEDQSNV